jgi:hypothetical protein
MTPITNSSPIIFRLASVPGGTGNSEYVKGIPTRAFSKVRDSSSGSLVEPIEAQPLIQMADKKHTEKRKNVIL